MEIIKLSEDTWQLVEYNGDILIIGSYDECLARLVEIEDEQYMHFLMINGI
jgi:hypothetical protein